MLSENELYILSYYRACELAGSLLFGRLAFHTDIDSIRIPLTHHCLEEAEHAWLWTETIKELGSVPIKVTQTYQTEYGKEFGLPANILEIFCLTQVFEKRTLDHFQKHLNMPGVAEPIKKTLQKMIDDESGHLSWIKDELDRHSKENGPEVVTKTMKRLEEIDERVYRRLTSAPTFQEYFGNRL